MISWNCSWNISFLLDVARTSFRSKFNRCSRGIISLDEIKFDKYLSSNGRISLFEN